MYLGGITVNTNVHKQAAKVFHMFHHMNEELTTHGIEDPLFDHKSRNISEAHCYFRTHIGTWDWEKKINISVK